MLSTATQTPRRRLVLGRETLRTLTAPRNTLADMTVAADPRATSCGEACTCACDTQTI
jgi:hypothetical protein